MSIDIGAQIVGIQQVDIRTVAMEGQEQHTYVRHVTMLPVGLPPEVGQQAFTMLVMDATQWDQLQVGKTVTISLTVLP